MLSKNFEYTGQRLYLLNIDLPMSLSPASATASRRRNSSFSNTQKLSPSCHTRPSLAASVVLENQRSSIPPRCAPYAYQSSGCRRMRLPGCKNERGTQVGVRRSRPWPASRARLSKPLTLSRFVIFARGLATVDMNTSPWNGRALWNRRRRDQSEAIPYSPAKSGPQVAEKLVAVTH